MAEAGDRAQVYEGEGSEDAPPPAGPNEVADVLRRAGLPGEVSQDEVACAVTEVSTVKSVVFIS